MWSILYTVPCSCGSSNGPGAVVPGDTSVYEARAALAGEAPVETTEYVAVGWAEKLAA